MDGYIYAVRSASAGLALSSWPRFHHDNQNTGKVHLSPSEPFELELVFVQGGTFMMGSDSPWAWDGEQPVHEVSVSSFHMSKYEVTQSQFAYFDPNHDSYSLGLNKPVQMVNWYDAARFCNWLSQREGYEDVYNHYDLANEVEDFRMDWDADGYRLPTEAEWEYACRAGTATDYYNGDETYEGCSPLDSNLDMIAWYCGNASEPQDIGSKQPNGWGLRDMSGNVTEWVNDRNHDFTTDPQVDPQGPDNGDSRIVRGGSYASSARECRSSYRPHSPGGWSISKYTGFRVVRAAG